ncbi:serine hydrolase domain-containing protein [Streptomyces lydicus]|uniref:serine hydrolase domain-containing protein n=1 Tax=Streptomyces lydicus TaxID=47763 RepID=UPI00101242FC|nr:serine hydrolase [Streptomyces lydicus]MCZ1005928.1 serine hydrolase [Streptomyces lydicus]
MSASMQTPLENPATPDNWLEPPDNHWAFNHMERLLSTAVIPRGRAGHRRFAAAEVELEEAVIATGEGSSTVAEFLARTATDAIVVLRGEQMLFERYYGEAAPHRRHALMSISKSIAGMAAGCLVAEGVLDVSATVETYVPELASSAYGTATVREVLDMTAALRFSQDYDDPRSQVQTGDRAAGWRPQHDGDPAGVRAFLTGLEPDGPHGRRFQYCSATTDVLAWVLERAAGQPYPDVLGERVWSRIGAEHDAVVTVDPEGAPYACAGISATARDLARFGRCVLDGGVVDGRQVIPQEWIHATRRGGRAAVLPDRDLGSIHPNGTYRNQWWNPGDSVGTLFGIGIFGQYLWLDPQRDVVIVKLSSLPHPRDARAEHAAGLAMIAAAVGSGHGAREAR